MGRRVGLTPFPETSGGGGGAREGRRLGPDASPPLPRRIAARCPPGLEQQHHADLCLGCKPGPAAAGRGRLSAPPGKPAPAPGSERRAGSGGSLELGSAQRRLREAERARRGRGRGACVRSHRQREEGRREPWPGTASRPCRTTSSPTAASPSLSASAGARPAASDQSSEVFGGRWVRLCVINTDLEKKMAALSVVGAVTSDRLHHESASAFGALWNVPWTCLALAPTVLFLEPQQPSPSGQMAHSTPSLHQGLPEPWDCFGPSAFCSELTLSALYCPKLLLWPCRPPATLPFRLFSSHMP
ncbi:uridine-cytidine kinase 2 isoform X2 [Camelus bactrianus]|uniref:Uridine-cytidine kinase 2 isoform X2 n=1 Tax=Camelus bactrianus TaxID=9837 RepID=A0AC58P741_CAMBA